MTQNLAESAEKVTVARELAEKKHHACQEVLPAPGKEATVYWDESALHGLIKIVDSISPKLDLSQPGEMRVDAKLCPMHNRCSIK